LLREKGISFEEVDLNKGLSVAELDRLDRKVYRKFLNTRTSQRERG
jgi:hypothetical protein